MADPSAAPFPTAQRAREAERLGMLLFLATEIMLFGGLFVAALAIRIQYPADYARASGQLHLWLGGVNTAILLTSSLLVALAVEAVRRSRPRLAAWLIGGALALGLAFLAVKGFEYRLEFREGLVPGLSGSALTSPRHALFMNLYFAATGLHAVHVAVGLALLGLLIAPLGGARRDPQAMLIGNAALYWHLVDIVWIFLYPTLYLARG